MATVKSRARRRPPKQADEVDGGEKFRRRLLEAMADSIAEHGYAKATVAEIVGRARTSRRTFYQYFADREACYVALLTQNNAEMVRRITEAVDPLAPWHVQVRQAVDAWITAAESRPAVMLSWIRDAPGLGAQARRLQREFMEAFAVMVQSLTDSEQLLATGVRPVSWQRVIMLLGGLHELTAWTLERGGRMSDIAEEAYDLALALLGPQQQRTSD